MRHPWYSDKVATSANRKTVDFLKSSGCRYVAEFGILRGATSLEIAKYLGGYGSLWLFDFEYNVNYVMQILAKHGFANVQGYGCSTKPLDSYNWPLMKILERNPSPVWDYVFIDGAHTWNVDALTFLLADRLLHVGGFIDFDDYHWSLAISPTLNPEVFPPTAELYTDEQIEERQVKKIIDILVRRDSRYIEVVPRKIFQKRSP